MNNYEKLLCEGIKYNSVVFDNTPLSVLSSSTVGEYLNIRPQGLNSKQFKKYLQNRIETIRRFADCSHSLSQRTFKAKQKARINARISSMLNPCPFTQTFTDDSLKTDYERKIKGILNSLKIPYVLITDYGKEKDRIHFHGFLDITPFQALPEETFVNDKTTKSGVSCNFSPLECLGWNSLTFPQDAQSIQKSLRYFVKYMTKDQEKQGFKHKIIASRKKKT